MVLSDNMPKQPDISNVFIPGNIKTYQKWRDQKLADYPKTATELQVSVADLSQPTNHEITTITRLCSQANMAFFSSSSADSSADQSILRQSLLRFCNAFGLNTTEQHRSKGEDGIVPLEVAATGSRSGYIPYTDKPLSWHTDGYYNAADAKIRAMVLHCVTDAMEGGANELLDPEIVYCRLRDENPDYIEALMHRGAMTIPENTDPRSDFRPVSIGPVFSVGEAGALQMRYTARARNIIWRDDATTTKARDCLKDILASDPLIIRHKLRPGEGLISNNVLHNRTKFSDAAANSSDGATTRLLYRIRYGERIANT